MLLILIIILLLASLPLSRQTIGALVAIAKSSQPNATRIALQQAPRRWVWRGRANFSETAALYVRIDLIGYNSPLIRFMFRGRANLTRRRRVIRAHIQLNINPQKSGFFCAKM